MLANLLDIDLLYQAKIFTFSQSFEQTFLCFYQDATVLVGTIQPAPVLEPFEIVAQAQIVQELHQFRFPLVQVAPKVLGGGEVAEYLSEIAPQPLLGDSKLPPGYLEGLDTNSFIFAKNPPRRSLSLCFWQEIQPLSWSFSLNSLKNQYLGEPEQDA